MKKILAIMLCIMLISLTPVIAFANDSVDNVPTTEEVVTDTEISVDAEVVKETLPEKIVGFITENYTGSSLISLAVTIVVYIFYEIRKHRILNASIGTLNNNAITVAENSAKSIKEMLTEAKQVAGVVDNYKDEMIALLTEIRQSAEEKETIQDTLKNVEAFLKTAKLATLELSNEVAELLVLANIPNSKKEELYSRHVKAVKELSAAEEVTSNDGTEA